MMKQKQIEALATELGVSNVLIRKWRERGVPYRWRVRLIDAAVERGLKLRGNDFERMETRSEPAGSGTS